MKTGQDAPLTKGTGVVHAGTEVGIVQVYLPEDKIQGYLDPPPHWTSAVLTVTPETTYSTFLSLSVQPGIVHLGPPVGALGAVGEEGGLTGATGEEGGLTGATGGFPVGAVGEEGGLTGATGGFPVGAVGDEGFPPTILPHLARSPDKVMVAIASQLPL
jgi:hypothetical protein